jgi:hypothetical protein
MPPTVLLPHITNACDRQLAKIQQVSSITVAIIMLKQFTRDLGPFTVTHSTSDSTLYSATVSTGRRAAVAANACSES